MAWTGLYQTELTAYYSGSAVTVPAAISSLGSKDTIAVGPLDTDAN